MKLLLKHYTMYREEGVALVLVLAFVVLLAGMVVAYLARTSADRQLAHNSFNQIKADQLARSALDIVVADLKQEIVDGSIATTVNNRTIYTPASNANILPIRSGHPSGTPDRIPNLVRRSVRVDAPGVTSRASAVNSQADASLNGRTISFPRWNKHYLIPKANTGNDQTDPVTSFTAPDWVLVTNNGPKAFAAWDSSLQDTTRANFVAGRYAYAIYDEGGLLDANVAGYPIPTPAPTSSPAQPYAFKGSLAYADMTALPTSTASPPSTFPPSQVNNIVAWRNYASTQPDGDFQNNFTFTPAAAQRYFNFVANNNGALTVATTTWNRRTDQAFVSRQELIEYRSSSQFSANALQYFGTFSRELNSPSFSPPNPTSMNPNFSQLRVMTEFTRFDGTSATFGEPLLKTRCPLSRLAWITYKGPSASLFAANPSDPVIAALLQNNVSLQTIQAGTAANIHACFGLTYVSSPGNLWTYSHGARDRILRLDEVAAVGREPDFFELLQAAIRTGSLGQNTSGGVTGGGVFPDIHMSNTTHHIFSIGAAIIDQSDRDSIPTRIQFNPNGTMWTAYGVESLPYITQIYPVAGTSPDDSTAWAIYLLFQLWNPHQNIPTMPPVRLRVDGGIGIFKGGNGEVWNSGAGIFYNATGQSITLSSTASFAPSPAPLLTTNSATTGTTPGTFAAVPISTPFVGFRLPDFKTSPVPSPSPSASPRVMLQFGATNPPQTAHPFNVTMEVDAGGGVFLPYNHFIGINDSLSWISGASVAVRDANSAGAPRAFTAAQLTQAPPSCFMKADPRSARFGIFQIDTTTSNSRVVEPLWSSATSLPNGYGGNIVDPGGPVEHAPLRFVGGPYYPATMCINNAPSTSTRTSYTDNDGVIRPADATYPDPTTSARASTPYYPAPTPSPRPTLPPNTTFAFNDYQPVIINRPFRSVAELGYAFRDLPWKSLDFFTDSSADAGLLDVFSINEEPGILAGRVNLNTRQVPVLQSVLAGAILAEFDSTNTVLKTGTSATAAPVMATNIVAATSTTPLLNRSELITRSGLPTSILPVPLSGSVHDQRVKARREVVARAITSVSQTRTWNLIIDVIAQSGRYPPTATTLSEFVVEGEKRYWLHVAIDRFTGEIIDQQLEAVYE